MQQLGLGAHVRKSAFCPFHENTQTPAFSVYEDPKQRPRWKCHAGCGGGDELEFLKKSFGLSTRDSIQRWKELASHTPQASFQSSAFRKTAPLTATPRQAPVDPLDAHRGSRNELEALAVLRGVSLCATRIMDRQGLLKFGTVQRALCWIVSDYSGRLAEARRLDGEWFAGGGKVHSLKHSVKSWPLGLAPSPHFGPPNPSAQILLTEGSGDFVAAFHFSLLKGPPKWQPVSVLGKSPIHAEALPQFANRSVLIVPHVDEDGGGMEAATRWHAQLTSVGCRVRMLDLSGLTKRDFTPIKDLNDCVHLGSRDLADLEEVFA
jgi:hypothetical protein